MFAHLVANLLDYLGHLIHYTSHISIVALLHQIDIKYRTWLTSTHTQSYIMEINEVIVSYDFK